MSIIQFVCTPEQKPQVVSGVWEIVKMHYFRGATPNNTVQFEYEGKDVYLSRIDALMQAELCAIADTEEGFSFTFDSTEDAGMAIAAKVYGTDMGYCDGGLTFVHPIFKALAKDFKDVKFEAHAECYDSWVGLEIDFSYNGTQLMIDGVPYEKYELFMSKMSFNTDVEALAEEVGITPEQAYAFLG